MELKCSLCAGRGFVVVADMPLTPEARTAIVAAFERASREGGTPVFEPGIRAVPCPVCGAPDERAMFVAAAFSGLVQSDYELPHKTIVAEGIAMWTAWQEWKEREREETL